MSRLACVDLPAIGLSTTGANVQVLAALGGRLLWASPALPGSTCDLTAAEHHGIGYIGADGTVVHGRKRYRNRALTERDEHRNQTIAKLRSPAERANATLKTWHILTGCCGSLHHLTAIIQAILTCEHTQWKTLTASRSHVRRPRLSKRYGRM